MLDRAPLVVLRAQQRCVARDHQLARVRAAALLRVQLRGEYACLDRESSRVVQQRGLSLLQRVELRFHCAGASRVQLELRELADGVLAARLGHAPPVGGGGQLPLRQRERTPLALSVCLGGREPLAQLGDLSLLHTRALQSLWVSRLGRGHCWPQGMDQLWVEAAGREQQQPAPKGAAHAEQPVVPDEAEQQRVSQQWRALRWRGRRARRGVARSWHGRRNRGQRAAQRRHLRRLLLRLLLQPKQRLVAQQVRERESPLAERASQFMLPAQAQQPTKCPGSRRVRRRQWRARGGGG